MYYLRMFMIHLDFTGIELKLRASEGTAQVYDPVRRIWVNLTPEEHVRQHIIYLLLARHYPASLMAVEKKIIFGRLTKRFDIVVYNRNHVPWMLIECKAPEVAITENTLHQLLAYQKNLQCKYWVLTNGHQTFCANAHSVENMGWLDALPTYNS
ncbi:MAG: type I restriction enzyme HsdR N-terminal domain-containing protein [Bacteroidetes bacterium]|nr:type I restriction enzyme HsdR N-terminal domain-containing protein [Bacteroidota bacterium]